MVRLTEQQVKLLRRILPSITLSDTVYKNLEHPTLITYVGNYVWSFHSNRIVYLTYTNSAHRPQVTDEELTMLTLIPDAEAKREYLKALVMER